VRISYNAPGFFSCNLGNTAQRASGDFARHLSYNLCAVLPLKNIFIQLSIEGDFHVPTGGKCLPELFGIVGNGHIDKLFLAAAGTQ